MPRDANDILREEGADALRDFIDAAEPYEPHGNGFNLETPTPILQSIFAEELEQQELVPVEWCVENFIPSRAVTGFFGDGGTGTHARHRRNLRRQMAGSTSTTGPRNLLPG
jgi:hypothetical protein